jgi:maltose alpha-D-glucosyltransferase/alpha-amylase
VNLMPQTRLEAAPSDLDWYKDAIIYQLHVKAFADSNNDGIGDFSGLTDHLDYLNDLGVTTIWLLPFYPSPGRDDGYDISDYRRINPDFGTMKDFRRFMGEAKRRGLRVITELVINHTSDQHPWFKRSRRSRPGTDARNWYVWSDTDQRYRETRVIFTDMEKSNWTWDPDAGAYYWHRFFAHQPDLNYDNPRVLWALVQTMRRWLDLGVDGFRLDAIPYLCEREGTNNENLPETHAVVKKIRAELDAYAPGRVLLAEANQWPEDVSDYFGGGDECHMAYHFPLMPRIYMAIAQEDRFPITDIVRQTPDIPENCQWALFLRNHDELTLEMVTDAERDYLWSTYAVDPRARINLGIRRRLAPLMDNDRRKIELMNSLLLSFPGTPIIYYGDEIGMGDNIYLGDRNGVRTPMQWTPDRNGGFSRCDPAKLYLPMIMDPVYGYQAVNVEAQSRSLSSLLSWMKRLITVRKSMSVFGRGSMTFIRPSNRAVLVYVRQYHNETLLCVANLSRSAQAAVIDLSAWRGRVPLEVLGRTRFPRIGDTPYVVTLAPYGFFWFQMSEAPDAAEPIQIPPEIVTLVIAEGVHSVTEGRARSTFETDILPAFLGGRRWFADKGGGLPRVQLPGGLALKARDAEVLLAIAEVATHRGQSRYVLPLTIKWTSFDRNSPPANLIAAVRRGAREGMLMDVGAEIALVEQLLTNTYAGASLQAGSMRLEFCPTALFTALAAPVAVGVQPVAAEQSNTTSIVEGREGKYVVKMFRRLQAGPNPEIEMGQFLTEVVQYPNTPPLLGFVELVEPQGRSSLAVIHRFVENQGDAWSLTRAHLGRFIDERRVLTGEPLAESPERTAYLQWMRQVGRRTAEMQRGLTSRNDLPAFAPEVTDAADVAAWTQALLDRAGSIFEELAARRADLAEASRDLAEALLGRRDDVTTRIRQLLPSGFDAIKIRHHGDFHLGQILIVKDDVFIIDFEGEPARTIEDRRRKAPAARDVAGLLRSIDYSTSAALGDLLQAPTEEREKILMALEHWRQAASEAFLGAYREHLGVTRLWPSDQSEADRLLEFFVLEKAIYEIGYELANRPNWLGVPLLGAWRVLFPGERPER